MLLFDVLLVSLSVISSVNSIPEQDLQIIDQNELTNSSLIDINDISTAPPVNNIFIPDIKTKTNETEIRKLNQEINDTALQMTKLETSFVTKFYIAIKRPIVQFMEEPRVSVVLKNIGTCIVNGAMEIISYYFPAPLIPLIASAAGTMIPFEPVVMLRKRMPVTSYRRAFNQAVNSFMGTFDRFKTSAEDPYMTGRFNRRFMGDNSVEKKSDGFSKI